MLEGALSCKQADYFGEYKILYKVYMFLQNMDFEQTGTESTRETAHSFVAKLSF